MSLIRFRYVTLPWKTMLRKTSMRAKMPKKAVDVAVEETHKPYRNHCPI